MVQYIRVVLIHFDNMENRTRDAIVEKEVGVFFDDPPEKERPRIMAWGKVQDWLKEQSPTKMYLGHNDEVYPQYRLIRGAAK